MADAPVGGRDTAAETGRPARIPVSEPLEIEADAENSVGAEGTGDDAADARDVDHAGEGAPTAAADVTAGEAAGSTTAPETVTEAEPGVAESDAAETSDAAGAEAGSESRADQTDAGQTDAGQTDAGQTDADETETTKETSAATDADAAETQVVAKPAFDAFAPKVKTVPASADLPTVAVPPVTPTGPAAPAASAKPDSGPEPEPPAKLAPIPVAEAPDLEAEAEAELAAENAERAPETEPDSASKSEAASAAATTESQAESDPAPDGLAAETVVVGAVGGDAADADNPEDDPDADEPALLTPESDETTLIPKVPEKPTESTTVMPTVASPQSDMARRPFSPAPAGYGSARQAWGGDEHGGPDAQATRVQPPVRPGASGTGSAVGRAPGSASSAANRGNAANGASRNGSARGKAAGRGYRPPEFHAVDPQRSQLPPPQNFKLDPRELEGDDGRGRKLGRRALIVGGAGAVAAVAGLTAAGVIKLPGTTPKVPTVGFAPATNSGASDATQTGTAFLSAWQNGELEAAANITDDPQAALAALTAYKKNLGVVGMVMNPNAANAVGWMTYSVTTQAGSPMGQWQYSSGFATYSKNVDGYTRWFVKWDPQILYTSLKPGYQLQIQKTPATIKGLVDRNNKLIDPTQHPSLGGIISIVMKKAKATGATDGQDIIMTDAKGKQVAKVATLTPPINNGTVATTFDLDVQTAAEAAVGQANDSSMVVIQPSTGHILAIANNSGSQYFDEALETKVAPGSTFKIITSAALLSKNLTTLDSDVPCPPVITIDTNVLKNSEGESLANPTYEQDFAASCNNAFSSFWDVSGVAGDLLANTAKTYFGLNQKWDIGLGEPTQYMTVPTNLHRTALAECLVGQGDIVATPLTMCSVAATVATGTFKQPIILPKQQQLAATPLGSDLQGKLKTLMGSVVSEGTAAGIFPNNGHFFGKTGTAEVGSGASLYNNSWFVVFNDQHDIAVCARAIKGGYGAQTAAPECLTVFKKLGYA